MPSLPTELIIEVVAHVATPTHTLAYSLPRDALDTLRTLALVNGLCRAICLPYLYQRIYVCTASQLKALLNVTSYLRLYTRSLAIGSLPFASGMNLDVCHLVDEVAESVERLMINCWGGQTEQERKALANCAGLREFVLAREYHYWSLYTPSDRGLHMTLPSSWSTVRRLSLYRVHLDDFLLALAQFPRLQCLCLGDCWLPTTVDAIPPSFTSFLSRLASLRYLFFMVYTEEVLLAKQLIQTVLVALRGRGGVQIGLKAVNLLEERYNGGLPGVLTQLAASGGLWDPETWVLQKEEKTETD